MKSAISTAFGTDQDGKTVYLYTLKNDLGMTITLLNTGATLADIVVPDKNGAPRSLTLGYPTIEGYLNDSYYMGCIVGRYGNRIANGRFTLNGKEYQLACNNGPNHLHGGPDGFHRHNWQVVPDKCTENAITLALILPHLHEGYPAEIEANVTYRLATDQNCVEISYLIYVHGEATILNPTNHAYFNLGYTDTILQHQLFIHADAYTPVGPTMIPTGEIKSVKGSPFDFTVPKTIEADIEAAGGYDHNFVFNPASPGTPQAILFAPDSGIRMEMHTTEPGVQFYTGNFLDGVKGRGQSPYPKHGGLCLEAQHFPDSPNQPKFPSTIVNPGEYRQITSYSFSVAKEIGI